MFLLSCFFWELKGFSLHLRKSLFLEIFCRLRIFSLFNLGFGGGFQHLKVSLNELYIFKENFNNSRSFTINQIAVNMICFRLMFTTFNRSQNSLNNLKKLYSSTLISQLRISNAHFFCLFYYFFVSFSINQATDSAISISSTIDQGTC